MNNLQLLIQRSRFLHIGMVDSLYKVDANLWVGDVDYTITLRGRGETVDEAVDEIWEKIKHYETNLTN